MSNKFKPLSVQFMIFGMVFLIPGLIQFAIGFILLVNTMNFTSDAAIVEGKISNIDISYDSDGEKDYDVYVDYEVDGIEYSDVHINSYSSSMYEGKEIELYYNPEYPTKIRVKSMVYFAPIILFGIGAVFFIIGISFIACYLKKKKNKKKLLSVGKREYAEVIGGRLDRTYSINGRNPYIFECRYFDPMSGQPVICTSERTLEDPQYYIGRQVTVYVDPTDRSSYYVDLDGMFNQSNITL